MGYLRSFTKMCRFNSETFNLSTMHLCFASYLLLPWLQSLMYFCFASYLLPWIQTLMYLQFSSYLLLPWMQTSMYLCFHHTYGVTMDANINVPVFSSYLWCYHGCKHQCTCVFIIPMVLPWMQTSMYLCFHHTYGVTMDANINVPVFSSYLWCYHGCKHQCTCVFIIPMVLPWIRH